VLERVLAAVVSFVVTLWFVRYLGPARYGLYSYAVSLTGLFAVGVELGLEPVLVRELTRAPDAHGRILGTALVLRTAGAAVAWTGAAVVVLAARDDALTRVMVMVLAAGSFGLAAAVFDLWFQAHIAARNVVLARSAVLVIAALARAGLIALAAPLLSFAVLQATSVLASAGLVYALYARARPPGERLVLDRGLSARLLRENWPLFVFSLSILVYMKIGQVMLTALSGPRENGIFAAAAGLSELWYFLPVAVASSLYPLIVKAHDQLDPAGFEARMQRFYDGMCALGYAVAIPMMVLASPIVKLLYGPEYDRAGGVLAIHAASFLFVCVGIARGRFLFAAGLTRFAMATGLLAAAVSVALNALLIPWLGARGVAWSTLVSYTVANYLTGFLHPAVRRHTVLITRALLVPLRPRALARVVIG
jgi:polysaccharide transporter, PST family